MFCKMLVYLLPVCPVTQHKLPLLRAHGFLPRLLQILTAQYRRREPTCPVRFHPARVPGTLSRTETRASCAVPLGHGLSPAKGTRAPSAVPLCRGVNSATGYAFQTPPPSTMGREPTLHASRSKEAAATARRSLKRTCSPPPLPDHVVAVGLRYGKANSKTLLRNQEVVVGLRCGKANTKTPRSFARLDPVFPRDSNGRSILFPHQGGVDKTSYLIPLLQEA